MNNQIYTPRSMIDTIIKDHVSGQLINPCVCTKINIEHWEISVSMDSSILPGDLNRTEIRLYDTSTNADYTHLAKMQLGKPSQDTLSSSEDLLNLMKWCNCEINKELFIVYAKSYEVSATKNERDEKFLATDWYPVDRSVSVGSRKAGGLDIAACFTDLEEAKKFYEELKRCDICSSTEISWDYLADDY